MHKCDCGVETSRSRSTLRANGFATICPQCTPEEFAQPFYDPSDQKIWPDHIANPHKYKLGSDGIYHAKDELNQDTVDLMQVDPDAEDIAKAQKKKRLNRRTTPMTQVEIEQTCNKGADEWREWRKKNEKLDKDAWADATIQREVYLDRVRRESAKIDGTIQ